MRRVPYGARLAGVVALLGVAFTFALRSISSSPKSASASPPQQMEGSDVYRTRNWEAIRPSAADYSRYEAEDWRWRARYAPVIPLAAFATGAEWRPSSRQRLDDEVFTLVEAARFTEAIDALERWLASHPSDVSRRLELARLLNRVGRIEDSFAQYRELIGERTDAAVRAEYAAALLASARHDSAAAEYHILLARDSANVEYRLGLARSLAWGGQPRAAERELRWLARRLPGDTLVAALLRATRASFEPSVTEAGAWVAGEPTFAPYRLALARAFVREGHPERAFAQYDTLLATSATRALPP